MTPPPRSGAPAAAPAPWLRTLVLLTVAGTAFAFMQTLVLPALPYFRREFDTSTAWVTWIATTFLLMSSVLTPTLAKLGDMFGKQRVLVVVLGIFGAASLGAATSPNLETLIGFRALQGVGGATFPLSIGIVRDEFPADRIGLGVGTISAVFGTGGGLGLVLSGVIIEALGWQALFLIGAGPVLASAVLIARFVPESPARRPTRPDVAGAVVLAGALLALMLALSQVNSWGWLSPPVLALAAAAAALMALWWRIERRAPDPMVRLDMLTRPSMAITHGATVLVGTAIFGVFITVPNFVQVPAAVVGETYGFGASLVAAGTFFIPSSLGMLVAGPVTGALTDRVGAGRTLRIGLALLAAAPLSMAVAHGEPWMIYAAMLAFGLGVGTCLASLGSLVLVGAQPGETGIVAGMNNIMRTVGGLIGAQLAAAILAAGALTELAGGAGVPPEETYVVAFLAAACGPLLALGLLGSAQRRGHAVPRTQLAAPVAGAPSRGGLALRRRERITISTREEEARDVR
jgi:MFS family permease